jgi:flagellin
MTVINTNVKSLVAQDAIMKNNRSLSTSMQRLSTGSRINSAKDDAAGLAISTRMDSQVRGLNMAIRNANDGISLMQTAEGAMDEVTGILQRMRELSVQSVNGTNNDSDRTALNDEVKQLKSEIDRIASTTEFNSQKILNGSFKDKKLQIGDQSYQTMDISVGSVALKDLGMGPSGLSANTLVSSRVSLAAADAGDITVNDQALGAIKSTDDIQDVVKNINDHVDNVKASAFNVITAKYAGTGVTTDGQLKIKVQVFGAPDVASTETTYSISASNSMQELVDNINTQVGGTVKASINDQGKLMLENTTGATISVADQSAGSAAAPSYESASGFSAQATTATYASFTGFLKIESTNSSPVRVDVGNKALATPGAMADLASVGFRPVTSDANYANDAYTVTGLALTSVGVAGSWTKTDVSINGTQIWNPDIKTDSFQGKLDAINNFSAQTGVQASAYYNESFTVDPTKLVAGNKVRLNGTELTLTGNTVSSLATVINAQTTKTGLVASVNGNNLVLTGANTQSVDIQYVDPNTDLHNSLSVAVAAVATDSAAARAITISTDIAAGGRTYTLTVGTHSYTYASLSTDGASEIAGGLRAAFLADATNSALPGTTVTAAAGVLTLGASVGAGVLDVKLTITNTPNPLGAAATHYGAIRLNSVNDQPISIALGDDAAVAEHGLLEANVGDGQFGLNATTFGSEAGGSLLGMNISTADAATKAITTIDQAIEKVSSYRSKLGAMENRLNNTVNNLSNIVTNTQASRSRIQDTDYASETTALAKAQIISQAATAMLAQANQQPQSVLSLLK